MGQGNLFYEDDIPEINDKYARKIKVPIYEPKNRKPRISELYDASKTRALIKEIACADITDNEKVFLIEAAKRHTVFNYSKIADYYAHATKEMQELMERSALVIIDFNKAIEIGYVKLSNALKQAYLEEKNDI